MREPPSTTRRKRPESIRRSAVGTSETSVAPPVPRADRFRRRSRRARRAASAGQHGACHDRQAADVRQRQACEPRVIGRSHRAAPTSPRPMPARRRGSAPRPWGAGRAARGDDQRIAVSTPRPSRRVRARRRRSAGRARSPRARLVARSAAGVDRRERGIAGIPDPAERVDELVAAGQVDRNEVRHGQKATVTAVNRWILGARPRTLPAAVVPVAIGAGAAVGGPSPVWWRVGPALIVSLALQIGVNYANDYSDGVRGTDDVRVGPVRLVAGGSGAAEQVKRPRSLAFGVAARRRPGAGGRHDLVADRRRGCWRCSPAGATPAGPSRTATSVSARCSCSSSSVSSRRSAPPTSSSRGSGACLDGRLRRRLPGVRAAGGQQPARHPDRSRRRQAHPRGSARRWPNPVAVRRLPRRGRGPDRRDRRGVAVVGGDRPRRLRRRRRADPSGSAGGARQTTDRRARRDRHAPNWSVGLLLAIGLALGPDHVTS